MSTHKNEGFSISFLGVFFPTPPLMIPHFYDVIKGLSSSSKKRLEEKEGLVVEKGILKLNEQSIFNEPSRQICEIFANFRK